MYAPAQAGLRRPLPPQTPSHPQTPRHRRDTPPREARRSFGIMNLTSGECCIVLRCCHTRCSSQITADYCCGFDVERGCIKNRGCEKTNGRHLRKLALLCSLPSLCAHRDRPSSHPFEIKDAEECCTRLRSSSSSVSFDNGPCCTCVGHTPQKVDRCDEHAYAAVL